MNLFFVSLLFIMFFGGMDLFYGMLFDFILMLEMVMSLMSYVLLILLGVIVGMNNYQI